MSESDLPDGKPFGFSGNNVGAVAHFKVQVLQRARDHSVACPGQLVAMVFHQGRSIYSEQLSTDTESMFLGNRADVQAVMGSLGDSPHEAALKLHTTKRVAPFHQRLWVFANGQKLGFAIGTEGHWATYVDTDCVPVPPYLRSPTLEADVSEIVDVAQTVKAVIDCDRVEDGRRLKPGRVSGEELIRGFDPNAELSHADLALRFGLNPEALRKRLERWRKKHIDGWIEVANPTKNEPLYRYRLSAVHAILEQMAPGETSSQRPTK